MRSVFLGVLLILVSLFGTVTVIAPNGGETITRGDQFEITWSDDVSEDVKIELYQNGIYNSDIISATPSDGSFMWNLGIERFGSNFQVKISSSVMPALHNDTSDGSFSIEREIGVINILTPAGGELFERGSKPVISWEDNIFEEVKIELYQNDLYYSTIVDTTESDGSYEWSIPVDLYGTFKIKITSVIWDITYGISENTFEVKKGSISISSPQVGDALEMFEEKPIVWTDDFPEDVKISLFKNTVLISELSSKSIGLENWNFYTDDLIAGNDYLLRIESKLFSDVYAETGSFSIKGTNNINGSVSGNWTQENSPYILTDSSYVESGNTLIVDPGVKVVGNDPKVVFNIEGRIDANGEYDNRIILENINLDFNSTDPDTSKIIRCNIEMVNNNYFFEKTPTTGRGYSLQQTSDKGFIITGEKNGDVLLLKTDQNGNVLWSKTYGGLNDDRGCSVSQTDDEGYIITGFTESYGSGGKDVWLIKTDADGNEEWNRTFGGISDDSGLSVISGSVTGYIIAGYTRSYGTSNSNDVWVIKTDFNGNEVWSKTFGGTDHDYGTSIRNTSDGNYIITGAIDYDVCLIKIDVNGNEVWSKSFNGYDYDLGSSVKQTSDDGYIISCTKDNGGANDYAWLIKTDSLGSLEWDRVYESGKYYSGASVFQTKDGGFIMGCHHYQGAFATLLIKTDSEGTEEWSKYFNYADIYNYQLLLSVVQTNDLGYVFTGYAYDKVLVTKTDQYGNVRYDDLAIEINNNSNVILQNNIIHNLQNYSITVNNASPVISNNLIVGNNGGIKFLNSSPQFVVNNTITENDSIGLYFDGNSDGQFVNNIIYGNKIKEVYLNNDQSDPAFYYNDIKGGQAGFGLYSGVVYSGTYANNISSDPMFTSVGFYLSETSPCIDAGYPGLTDDLLGTLYIPQTALLGNPRIYAEEIDIGCYEWNASGIEAENTVGELTLYQNYPNPFNPATTIKYSVPNDSNVKLNVFDITGREVCNLVDRMHSKGAYEVNFNGEMLSSGIYFYRLSVEGKFVAGRKMMLLK